VPRKCREGRKTKDDKENFRRRTCPPPPPVVFRSKLKVGESYGDKGSDDEQDGEHNAENAIESVGLIESPN
jgi:hypothetical protein